MMVETTNVGEAPGALHAGYGGRRPRADGPDGLRRHAVYLSDFSALGGVAALLEQAAAAERAGERCGARIAHYVDSGLPDGSPELGPAFRALLRDATADRFEAVAVAHVTRLAPRDAGVNQALAFLARLGVQVHTPTGRVVQARVRGCRGAADRGARG